MKMFDTAGITTTSAQHIISIANEMIKANNEWLQSMSFTEVSAKLLNSNANPSIIQNITIDDLNKIRTILQENSKYYSIIAYLSEAIKIKERAVESIPSIDEWCEMPTRPSRKDHVCKEDVIADWPLPKYIKYLRLEQFSATYGKAIHKDGPIEIARRQLLKDVNHPHSIDKTVDGVLILSKTSKFSLDEVDQMFITLQQDRRGYDKELNSMKAEILAEVNRRNSEIDREYARVLEEYQVQVRKLQSEYEIFYREKVEEIQTTWKIVIPDFFKEIYEYLNKLGR